MELVAEIRKTQPALPIVMMTAHASVDYAVGALRHQVDEFRTKPITAAELVPKVRGSPNAAPPPGKPPAPWPTSTSPLPNRRTSSDWNGRCCSTWPP